MTEQEKQAAENKQRLTSFDAGVEDFLLSNGLDKEAVAKEAGAKNFEEFAGWALTLSSALSKQAAEEAESAKS